jgi:hypothetical protein
VTETKKDSAQVAEATVETAIRLDKKEFENVGRSLNDATVSPMAGERR